MSAHDDFQRDGAVCMRGVVGPDLLAGTLVEVMPSWCSIELGVYAVYPSRKFVSPKVRLMIEFLVNAFRMRGWPA